MSFRQTYKGIFQFKDQAALERAMAENQAEAMGADALGLQECYYSEGVMLIDLDSVASLQDWEEMSVAIATLAMHAARGFLYAIAYDGGETGPRKEYYEASADQDVTFPVRPAPADEADFFVMHVGATYHYVLQSDAGESELQWTVREEKIAGETFYYFDNPEHQHMRYNAYWEGFYSYKQGGAIYAVTAADTSELATLVGEDAHLKHRVYDNSGQPGDLLFAINKESDHFLIFRQQEFVAIDTPKGHFPRCMKIELGLYHAMDSELYREQQTLHFAPGIGLVQWEKGKTKVALASIQTS
jgi:hypothetical protein